MAKTTRYEREGEDKYGLVLVWARECAARKNDWPGVPLSQIPLMCQPELRAAVNDGKAHIFERPSKVNPDRVAMYLVPNDDPRG